MLVALTLNGNLFAETEAREESGPEAAGTSAPASSFPAASESATRDFGARSLVSAPDFRNVRIADGIFDAPSSAAFHTFGVTMFAAAGADLLTTEVGLNRPGVYEANPVQGNRSVRILTHAAVPAFMYFVTEKLHDKGKTKAALFARIGFSIAYSYVAMHNLRTASAAP
jgi:hypothetical protein